MERRGLGSLESKWGDSRGSCKFHVFIIVTHGVPFVSLVSILVIGNLFDTVMNGVGQTCIYVWRIYMKSNICKGSCFNSKWTNQCS